MATKQIQQEIASNAKAIATTFAFVITATVHPINTSTKVPIPSQIYFFIITPLFIYIFLFLYC